MQFKTYRNKDKPVFLYIHGECLSSFSFKAQVKELKKNFTIVLPILDGHDVESEKCFPGISSSAGEIIRYIDTHHDGHIHVLSGFSLGGQIAVEILSKRPDICQFALIESAMMQQVKVHNWSYYAGIYLNALARQRWFNKFMYYTVFNDDFAFDDYNKNYQVMTKENIKQVQTAHNHYHVPAGLENVTCNMAIVVGQREKKVMKQSANLIKDCVENAQIYMLMNYTFGDFSLGNPNEYIRFVKSWVLQKDMQIRKKVKKAKKAQEGEYMPNWKHLLHKMKKRKEAEKA